MVTHISVERSETGGRSNGSGYLPSAADIERGFRVLKNELDIAPMFHRLPARIRAHAAICFIAPVLYRILRQRLQAHHTGISPARCLETLRRIQHHQVRLPKQSLTGVSTLTPRQQDLFTALNLAPPSRTLRVVAKLNAIYVKTITCVSLS